jgi:LysR family nitrogen assimilation transcriptional regulator
LDIRELRYFTQVARVGSFNKAAAQLNIAQPALSRCLKKLEDELGVQLLIRNGRGVELTEAGSILLAQSESLIFQMEETAQLVRSQKETFRGQVILGLPPTSGLLIAPKLIQMFRSHWPHASLVLREGISSSLEEWLVDRRIDLGVLHNPLPLDGIDMEPVIHERMVLVHAPGAESESAWGKTVRIRDLGAIPLILPSLPHSNRRLVERAVAQHGGRLNIVMEVDSVALIRSLVKQGFGQTIMTFGGVAAAVEKGELGCLPIDRPPLMSTVGIGMPREARSVWLTMETSRLLRGVVAGLAVDGEWIGARLVGQELRPD